MNDVDRLHSLGVFAERLCIEPEYWDVAGVHHVASTDALLAVIAAMGYDLEGLGSVPALLAEHERTASGWSTDPVLVAWLGRPFAFDLRLPTASGAGLVELTVSGAGVGETRIAVVDLDAAESSPLEGAAAGTTTYRVEVPPVDIAPGYHDLWISSTAQGTLRRSLFVAPQRVPAFGPLDRVWGVFAPTYALPGGSGLGAHIGDLGRMAAAVGEFGAQAIGTLPLLASWLGEPFDPSPYAPVSRRFWNELYVDLAELPELAHSPHAAANLDGLRAIGHAANERSKRFDYRHQYGFVRGVLEQVVADIGDWPATMVDAFVDFTGSSDLRDVGDYAYFRAYAEATGTGWHEWPATARGGNIDPADVDPVAVRLHEFAQYAMERGLVHLNAQLADRDQRLYLDLPVGAHSDGYDTWKHRDLFAWGAAAGAPPDDFFTRGQNWGFPPVRPDACRLEGHAHFRDVLRHHMAVAGIVRLDHVMGLHRMFWVPDGMDAADGVYVRSPSEDLFAVLAIESQRNDCIVIGEDLGTVPDEIRAAMDDHAMLGMYVAVFGVPAWAGAEPAAPRVDQLATIDTHDTPTFAGWRHGYDIDVRHQMGLVDDESAEYDRAARRQQVENLSGFLRARGDLDTGVDPGGDRVLLEAVLRFLGDSDARAVLVAVDDLVGETNPQNVPGTMVDRPNWVQRSALGADQLAADQRVSELLSALQECRLGSHLRAAELEGRGGDS